MNQAIIIPLDYWKKNNSDLGKINGKKEVVLE